jgi:hypothetical protein
VAQALFNGQPIQLPNIPGVDPALLQNLISQAEAAAPDVVYEYTTDYYDDAGLVQLVPAAVDGTPCRIAKLKCQSGRVDVAWSIMRFKLMPPIPPPIPPNPSNEVYLFRRVSPMMILPGADGVTPIYRISGIYTFACLKPHDPTQIQGGSPPFTTMPARQNVYNINASTSKTGVY